MLPTTNLQQLQKRSLDELKKQKQEVKDRQTALMILKEKGGTDWNESLQEELDNTALSLVDIDEVIKAKSTKKDSSYELLPGTEQMVHLSVIQGYRFNPVTGKEESRAYTQIFTFSEWQLFKKNYKSLGYTIKAVLHDPYGDAQALVENN